MNRIKQLRIEKGWSQDTLAKKLNISNAMISAYELGIRGINLEMLNKICELFDVSTDYLLCRTETRNIKEVNFANAGGLDTHGLTIEDLMELQRQADYMRKIKGIK